ncbi:hypothetical protein [Streptomyces sp. NPDC048603]
MLAERIHRSRLPGLGTAAFAVSLLALTWASAGPGQAVFEEIGIAGPE